VYRQGSKADPRNMVWGKPETGAWANAVEEEEQEHGK